MGEEIEVTEINEINPIYAFMMEGNPNDFYTVFTTNSEKMPTITVKGNLMEMNENERIKTNEE